jgi:hypothetical protein
MYEASLSLEFASFVSVCGSAIGINSLELDRQAVPLLCGGGYVDQVVSLCLLRN